MNESHTGSSGTRVPLSIIVGCLSIVAICVVTFVVLQPRPHSIEHIRRLVPAQVDNMAPYLFFPRSNTDFPAGTRSYHDDSYGTVLYVPASLGPWDSVQRDQMFADGAIGFRDAKKLNVFRDAVSRLGTEVDLEAEGARWMLLGGAMGSSEMYLWMHPDADEYLYLHRVFE